MFKFGELLAFALGVVVTAILATVFFWGFPKNSVTESAAAPLTLAVPREEMAGEREAAASVPTPSIQELPSELPSETLEMDPHWSAILMDALQPAGGDPTERNRRLTSLALIQAQGVPEVQEACVRHLTFSLPNEEAKQLLFLAVHPNLPLRGRKYLVEKSLRIRSPEVTDWLAAQLARHPEPEISGLATRYFERQRKRAAATTATSQGGEAAPAESTGPF